MLAVDVGVLLHLLGFLELSQLEALDLVVVFAFAIVEGGLLQLELLDDWVLLSWEAIAHGRKVVLFAFALLPLKLLVNFFDDFVATQHHGFVFVLDVVFTVVVVEVSREGLRLLADVGKADVFQVAPEVTQPLIALLVNVAAVRPMLLLKVTFTEGH